MNDYQKLKEARQKYPQGTILFLMDLRIIGSDCNVYERLFTSVKVLDHYSLEGGLIMTKLLPMNNTPAKVTYSVDILDTFYEKLR